MIAEVVTVLIDGERQDDVVPDIIEVEAEEAVESADVFRLRIALHVRGDGSWNYVDDERFRVWRRFSLRAGYPGNTPMLIDGYITHSEISIAGRREPYLEISGMDATAMMDLEERQIAWANKRDSEIAATIFAAYGLSHEVEDTVSRRDEATSTTMQVETDIRFLRRLAARNGFECFVHGGAGFFRSPNMQEAPQPPLAIEFGSQTNLSELRLSVDGTASTVVEMQRVDRFDKRVERRERATSPRRTLGRQSLGALRATFPSGRTLLHRQAAVNALEMDARLRQAYQGATEFVRVEGEIDSRVYRGVLRAKRLVTIKGVGASLSGMYYVTKVRHSFTVGGYTQRFEGYRNGIGLTGEEEFRAVGLTAAVLAGAGLASRPSGNRVLPAQQTATTIPGGL
jgi:phage protein D